MKWTSIGFSALLTCTSASAFATHVETIHGLEHAKNISPSSEAHTFYIYAGSFLKHENALRYQKSLQAKTNHKVDIAERVSHQKKFYVVIIGPLASSAEVKKTATALLSTTQLKHDVIKKKNTASPMKSSSMKASFVFPRALQLNDHWMWSLALGNSWFQTRNATLQITSDERDLAVVSQSTNNILYSAGMGYHAFSDQLAQNKYFTDLLIQLNYYYSSSTVKGNVWAFESINCDNFLFKAPMRTSRLMLDLKPELFTYRGFNSYGIFGAGASWNKMSYTESAINGTDPIGAATLQGHSNVTVAYDLGVGINKPITKNIDASIEYLYTSLGNIEPSINSLTQQSIVRAPSFSMQSQSVLARLNWRGGWS